MEIEDGLETRRRFIVEGNIECAKEVVSEYAVKLSSCFGQGGNQHLSGIQQDEIGTALIPRDTFTGQNNIAFKTTASMWLAENESLSDVI